MSYHFTIACYYTGSHNFAISRDRANRLLRHAYVTDQLCVVEHGKGLRTYRVFVTHSGVAFVTLKRM
jgi:hypothetical protein